MLPQRTLEQLRIALTEHSFYLLDPAGIEGVPLGRFYGEVAQRIYVPAYSHILIGDRSTPFNLAATLSVRNTDPAAAATVTAIDYHDGSGRLVKRHLARPHVLRPLPSTEVFVPESDTSGGFGASFLVTWTAETAIAPPVVECLLIGALSGQGISILSPGRVIEQTP